MNKKQLVAFVTDRVRSAAHYRPITKTDVEAVLDELGGVILKEVLLHADKVNLPGLGQVRGQWIGPDKSTLFASFDWDNKVETALRAASPGGTHA